MDKRKTEILREKNHITELKNLGNSKRRQLIMREINLKITSLLLIFAFCFSCSFYSDKNLGSNYIFWEDGNQSEIVYSENGPHGGFTIVDANVSQYAFDNKYIIAKSNWLTRNGMTLIGSLIKVLK